MFLLLTIGVITLLFLYLKLKYFTLRGPIPGLAPHFLFGNLIQSGQLLNGISLPQVCSKFKCRYGDIFQFWFGPIRFIMVNGITDVQHIFTHRNIYEQGDIYIEQFGIIVPNSLISVKGTRFKRHATITLPLFRRGKITNNFDLIVDCTDKLLANWRASPNKHVHCDVVRQSQNLMLQIFGLIGFDYDLEMLDEHDSNQNELGRALFDLLKAAEFIIFAPTFMGKLYTTFSGRHRKAQAISDILNYLQLLTGLSQNEVYQEMLLFLIAGFETTSTALAWLIHFLSKYPRVQQKIKAELMDICNSQNLSVNQLDSLTYLDCVINETLRFFPPANGTVRTLTIDDRLPGSGVQLYKGDSVLIPFHNLSHDTRLWSIDPNLFYPERFLGEDKNYNPYALIPFSSGHRQCIGQDLARFAFKLIVARIMQQITFGDEGSDINSGGHVTRLVVTPKHVGVTIEFV
ncbi:unnamed protein product [Rotaria sp. Silwood2]|nr:unnamed protein product [Rotaria sp. Silwood2]CAF4157130.1 unnamed protein product [Rotaria sp. Silwood2]